MSDMPEQVRVTIFEGTYPTDCTCAMRVNVMQYWYQIIEYDPNCPVHPDLDTLASETPAE